MRRLAIGFAVFAGSLVLAASAVAAPPPKPFEQGAKSGAISGFEVVGHTDLGGRGFNADVWAHEGFAYVGQWGFEDWASGSKERFCPEEPLSGVAVIDARDPTNPVQVATLQNPPGTSAEDVVVYTAEYGPYAGRDIAAVGLQYCGGSRYDEDADRGLMLWDVTDPTAPEQVGYLNTGCCTRGVHEFEIEAREDLGRIYAYASVPASRYPDENTASGYRDEDGEGDFRLIDITDPENPVQVSDWGIQDIGGPFDEGQGCDPDPNYGHSAEPSEDGKLVFVSYWDSGFVALDLTDPANPVYLGRTIYDEDEDGDAHSSMYDDARQLLFTADEDFCKTSGPGIETGYGYLRIYDFSDPSAPEQIGEFRTENSLGLGALGAGDFSIHNPFLVGDELYMSWYSDGIQVVDVSDPTAPERVAYFIPPAYQNPVRPPQRGTLSQTAQVWGVFVDERGLVYASDMNSGLWILRRT
jgi:hypothetical protein